MKAFGLIVILMMVTASKASAVPETVVAPAGKLIPFWMKTQAKGKKTVYKIKKLRVQINQVTNADFLEFVKQNPKWMKSQVPAIFADVGYLEQFKSDLELSPRINSLAPVTAVSWFAARAYCNQLGLRLPTIAEWEYLAAASEKSKDANQNAKFLERILKWYGEPKVESLPAVQSIYKNIYGLHDMHGLVWEWVEDFNSNLVNGESREDSSFNRDLFCGAGNLNAGDKENYAAFMRFAFRSSIKGNTNVWNLGFRCVQSEI